MARQPPVPPGFSRADLHVHTTFSDGTSTPEDLLNYYALHSDMRVFAITDHDTLDGAHHARRHAADHPELFGHIEIIVGEEVTSRDGHVIGLFVNEWVPPGMSAADTVAAIHAQGGLAVAAHPYTNLMRWNGLVGVGDLIRTVPFDAVETRNSNFTEVLANGKAERNAGTKARVGNSDGHFLDAIGRCYTEFPGRSGDDLRRALQERTTAAGGRCYGAWTLCKFALTRLRTGGSILPRRHDFRREAPGGGLELKVHEESSLEAAVLTPAGRIDRATMPVLKETLTQLAAARVGMVIDLSQATFLDSTGVTALVAGFKAARTQGIAFCLAALSPACARTLEAARLTKVFPRTPTVREARRRVAAGALAAAAAEETAP